MKVRTARKSFSVCVHGVKLKQRPTENGSKRLKNMIFLNYNDMKMLKLSESL